MQRRQKQNRPEGRPLHKEGESGGGGKAAKMEVGVGATGVAERGGGCHDLSDPSARRDVLPRSMCRPSAQVIAGGVVR
jgi:hypothetical protein